MAMAAAEIVRTLLNDPTNPEVVHRLVAPDATYVSLNFDTPELQQIMPWTGTRTGPEAILDTYTRVNRFWNSEAFEVGELFGEGENVAVFGRFSYRSVTLGKAITSPFAILAKVNDGRITFMQFMEDTFGTASTFRSGGASTYRSDPDGGEVTL
jgi:ketosteroid isomerase-like protein